MLIQAVLLVGIFKHSASAPVGQGWVLVVPEIKGSRQELREGSDGGHTGCSGGWDVEGLPPTAREKLL